MQLLPTLLLETRNPFSSIFSKLFRKVNNKSLSPNLRGVILSNSLQHSRRQLKSQSKTLYLKAKNKLRKINPKCKTMPRRRSKSKVYRSTPLRAKSLIFSGLSLATKLSKSHHCQKVKTAQVMSHFLRVSSNSKPALNPLQSSKPYK